MAGSFAASGETIFPLCSAAPARRMAPQASAPATPALSGKILFCARSFRKIRTKRNATWRWLRHRRAAGAAAGTPGAATDDDKTLGQIVQVTPGIAARPL